jgi:hypothetical protein
VVLTNIHFVKYYHFRDIFTIGFLIATAIAALLVAVLMDASFVDEFSMTRMLGMSEAIGKR